MELAKVFRIVEVHGTCYANEPYRLVVVPKEGLWHREKFTLHLDQAAIERQEIPLSLDLKGREILCTLSSRRLARRHIPGPDGQDVSFCEQESLRPDDLLVISIQRTEAWGGTPLNVSIPADARFHRREPHATIKLGSHDFGDGMPFNTSGCPPYALVVGLSEDEFRACIELPADTVFALQLSLLPPVAEQAIPEAA